MTQFGDIIRQIPQQVKQEVKVTYDASVIPVLNSKLTAIKQQLDNFQLKITQDIREQVQKEIQNGFEQQKSTLEDSVLSAVTRSQTDTPAPPTTFDHQEAIKQYLALGQTNKAFHQALVSNDLSLVEYTIDKADFNVVFSSPCPLEQTVLLSLIQQITVDMNRYSEIKNR
jgi:enhancer of mRNA-decapping protein 4